MNGIEKIIEKITGDAQGFAEQTLAEARQEAETVTAKYEEQAKRAHTEILEYGRAQAVERERRICAVAQMETRKSVLAKKQEMIAKAFAQATQKLMQLDDTSYCAVLCKFAVQYAQSGNEQLIFTADDRARFGEQVVKEANKQLEKAGRPHQLTLSEETRSIQGGLLLKEGAVEINCAMDTVIALLKDRMALEVAGALFTPDKG